MPDLPAWLARVTTLVMAIAAVQISARAVCCARIYGWWFASLVPLRILWANAVNAIATVSAIVQFVAAAVRHARPAWLKTEHVYPADVCVTVGPQHSGELRAEELSVAATRQLPLSAIRRWKVMPYRIDLGQLHLLTPAPPTEDAMRELGRYSALEFNFRLVTPREFARLADEVYGERLGSATTHRA